MNFFQSWFPSKEQTSVDELLDLWVPWVKQYKKLVETNGYDFAKLIDQIIVLYDEWQIQLSCAATRWKVENILNKYRK